MIVTALELSGDTPQYRELYRVVGDNELADIKNMRQKIDQNPFRFVELDSHFHGNNSEITKILWGTKTETLI